MVNFIGKADINPLHIYIHACQSMRVNRDVRVRRYAALPLLPIRSYVIRDYMYHIEFRVH